MKLILKMNKRLSDENDELLQSLTRQLLFSKAKNEPPKEISTNSDNLILIENLTKENKQQRDELEGISCLYLITKINQLIKKIE